MSKQNILITGAGGAAAVAFYKCLDHSRGYNIHMADMSRCAAGLYLVPEENRLLLPAGRDHHFVEQLLLSCKKRNIGILVPTVDWELLPIMLYAEAFKEAGVEIVISNYEALSVCLDKYLLMSTLEPYFDMAEFEVFDEGFDPYPFKLPCIAKPRQESGSRGIKLIHSLEELQGVPKDGSYLIQEHLPGKEYSVDVYLDQQHQAKASVVRERMRVDSGVAVISQTVINPDISQLAIEMAEFLQLRYAVNLQFKLDAYHQPKLLEINPRFPGTMSLTAAAGVNMPQLSIDEIMGQELNSHYAHCELAMVRFWQEQYMPTQALQSVCGD